MRTAEKLCIIMNKLENGGSVPILQSAKTQKKKTENSEEKESLQWQDMDIRAAEEAAQVG